MKLAVDRELNAKIAILEPLASIPPLTKPNCVGRIAVDNVSLDDAFRFKLSVWADSASSS
jgi:hypothetical protein